MDSTISNNITLIQLYTEYTGGNQKVINDIISATPVYSMKHKYLSLQIHTCCNDIDMIVNKTFYDFKYIRYPQPNTYCNNRKQFRGELNDVYMEFFNAFISLANSNIKINSQEQLCSILKKKTIEQVRKSLLFDDFTLDISQTNNNEEESSCNIIDKLAYRKWFSRKYSLSKGSYLYEIKELHHIQNSIRDILDVFPADAVTQKKLIEVLKNEEVFDCDNNSMILKKMSDISRLIKENKQEQPLSDERMTQTMNQIYSTLIRCVYGYVPCSRKDYCKSHNITSHTHNMLSDTTEQSIYLACKNNSISDRHYVKMYSLLTEQIKQTVHILTEQGFSPDIDLITDICLYERDPVYWNFTQSSEGYRLYYYGKSSDNDIYNLKRKRTKKFHSLPECYIIGNCVIYADKEQLELSYLQKEYRLFSVIKRDNKYIGHTINYNLIFGR